MNDAKEGHGVYYFNNGDRYEGEWKDDMFHGKGQEILADGSLFIGSWLNDERHGEGLLNKDGKTIRQKWMEGKLLE